MNSHRLQFSIEKMCKIFKVSKSGYYGWIGRPPCLRVYENAQLIQAIHRIYKESKGTYGSPRITAELNKIGFNVSRPRVARLMQQENIRSKVKKKYVVTTDSKHSFKVAPNLLDRNFTSEAPGKIWVSDLTYIRTLQGWLYLTVVLDLFDRKVIGWSLSCSMSTDTTTVPAMKMAINNRTKNVNLIFHSDRGVQYACHDFKQLLEKENVVQSMSRKGNCWDNAVAESFFSTLKKECIYQQGILSRKQTELEVFYYIESWYNRRRKHSALGYATPEEMEKHFFNQQIAA